MRLSINRAGTETLSNYYMKHSLLFIALLCGAIHVRAQNAAPEQLTNAKVIAMVKGGLPKAAIVKSIESKPGSFDTSTDALIALKKQGVPDDVITAMVSKAPVPEAPKQAAAKPQPAPFAPFKPTPPANAKDCKLREVKNKDGSKTMVVITPTKMGDFAIGRDKGKLTLVYNTSALITMIIQDTHNLATLRIDSAQFLFDDNTVLTLKTPGSYGTLPNKNMELKPQLQNVFLVVALEPGSKEEHVFTTTKLKTFRVFSEKDGKYGDMLNEKQQAKYASAFNCIPE